MVKKRVAMTTIYSNNYVFPQEYIGSMLAKQQIRELRKRSLLLTCEIWSNAQTT